MIERSDLSPDVLIPAMKELKSKKSAESQKVKASLNSDCDISIVTESPLGHGVVAKNGNNSVSPMRQCPLALYLNPYRRGRIPCADGNITSSGRKTLPLRGGKYDAEFRRPALIFWRNNIISAATLRRSLFFCLSDVQDNGMF